MARRCRLLEDSPSLRFNMGQGFMEDNRAMRSDTRQLRSTLFEGMLYELNDILTCQQQVGTSFHCLSYVYIYIYN